MTLGMSEEGYDLNGKVTIGRSYILILINRQGEVIKNRKGENNAR